MKTIEAFFGSVAVAILLLLSAIVATGCGHDRPAPADPGVPVLPATMVFAVDPPTEGDLSRARDRHTAATFSARGGAVTLPAVVDHDTLQADPMLGLLSPDTVDGDGYTTEMSIMEAATCAAVADGRPVHPRAVFQSQDGRVWCCAQVGLFEGSAGIVRHVWRHQGVEQLRVERYVEGPAYRTSSYKTIDETAKGDWTVEITTDNGEVLDILEFQVN